MQPVFDKNLFLKFCFIELMFYYWKKNVYKPALLLSLPSTIQTPFSHWHFTRAEKWQWGIEGVLAIFQAVIIMRLYTSSELLLITSSIVVELHSLLFPGAAVTFTSKPCHFNAKSWQSQFKWRSTWNEFGLIVDVWSRTL